MVLVSHRLREICAAQSTHHKVRSPSSQLTIYPSLNDTLPQIRHLFKKCLIKISFLWLLRTFLAGGSDGERDALVRSSLSPPRWPVRLQTLQGSGYCCSVLHLYNRSVAITWVSRPTDFQHCACEWFVQGMNEMVCPRDEWKKWKWLLLFTCGCQFRGSHSQCRVNIIFFEKEKCCWCTAEVQLWPEGEVEMRVSHVAAWANYMFFKKSYQMWRRWLTQWMKK